ncbi:MAG: zinc-ribbon domain-containing protein [Eubacteriales bacterium]|nr:zinc-ribbon domain-containing protein [Eubacteriales bacterium]
MICNNCGHEVNDSAKFCRFCGSSSPEKETLEAISDEKSKSKEPSEKKRIGRPVLILLIAAACFFGFDLIFTEIQTDKA